MENKFLSERIKKFNGDHSNYSANDSNNKILQARELNMLRLRRDHLDDKLMKSRMLRWVKKSEKGDVYSNLKISFEEIEKLLPGKFVEDFNLCEDQHTLIKEYLSNFIKYKNCREICDHTIEVYAKFAIITLRNYSIVMETNIENNLVDRDILDLLIYIIFNTDDPKFQVIF